MTGNRRGPDDRRHGGDRCGGVARFCSLPEHKGLAVADSILEAIRDGLWDFEPKQVPSECFDSTIALPGTDEKLQMLAVRIRDGLPLWHPNDRMTWDDSDDL